MEVLFTLKEMNTVTDDDDPSLFPHTTFRDVEGFSCFFLGVQRRFLFFTSCKRNVDCSMSEKEMIGMFSNNKKR